MVCLKIQVHELALFPLFFVISNHVWGGDYYPDIYSSFGTGKADFVWNDALNVMSFHRAKMNEYLCRNYLANEILEEFQNQSNVEKRVGELKEPHLVRDSLLNDPGSEKYKSWLSRSSTLEDIYRQFQHSEKSHEPHHHESEPVHEGEVTGFAVVGPNKHHYSKPIEYGDVESHYTGHHIESHPHHHEYYHDEEIEYEDKGLKLKELFHFALTAIAFLAFATFMIEVIMCLMEIPHQPVEPDYVLVPTSTGVSGSASKVEEIEPETIREDRTFRMSSLPLETINTISSKVLASIEAMTILYEDDGQCLRKTLCENSKFSKTLPGIQKIWLPIWNFGASWIARRLAKDKSGEGNDALQYLKATVLGLGKEECRVLYPGCDGLMKKRRRKRKAS